MSVKYGLITLIRQTTDLCEQMKQVEEKCPLDGEKAFTKTVEIPSVIPPVCTRLFTLEEKKFPANRLGILGEIHSFG